MPKTAIVIGASRGIGKAVVKEFSDRGVSTYGFARSLDTSDSDKIHLRHLDLTSPTLKADLEQLISSIDQIDYLINNAGAIVVKPFEELTREEILNCYQVNVISVMEVIQVCLPKMNAGSHIVNISSMGGFQGTVKFPGLSAYSPSKAAVVSLTEILAEELKSTGISINCLCLGAVQTEMMEEAFPGYEAPHKPHEIARYIVDFAINSGYFMHGRIVPVSNSTP